MGRTIPGVSREWTTSKIDSVLTACTPVPPPPPPPGQYGGDVQSPGFLTLFHRLARKTHQLHMSSCFPAPFPLNSNCSRHRQLLPVNTKFSGLPSIRPTRYTPAIFFLPFCSSLELTSELQWIIPFIPSFNTELTRAILACIQTFHGHRHPLPPFTDCHEQRHLVNHLKVGRGHWGGGGRGHWMLDLSVHTCVQFHHFLEDSWDQPNLTSCLQFETSHCKCVCHSDTACCLIPCVSVFSIVIWQTRGVSVFN